MKFDYLTTLHETIGWAIATTTTTSQAYYLVTASALQALLVAHLW